MDFREQLHQEIASSQKTNQPFWIILYQIERDEKTVLLTKKSRATDWLCKALNILKEQTDVIQSADFYGADKIVVIPKRTNESSLKNIAENISNQLVLAKSKDESDPSQ